ncbi:MAG: nucleotide exchange factor GrpE [Deltaproteobacteria bacterium]|nr:nucleotide exchange factor GrpE [Deltaproteobacteria bacterium]
MTNKKDGYLKVDGVDDLLRELEGEDSGDAREQKIEEGLAESESAGKTDRTRTILETKIDEGTEEEPEEQEESTEKILRNKLLRVAADFDNYKKRIAREKKEMKARAAEDLARDLLPVIDNLERAVEHADSDATALVQGIQIVYQQLVDTLDKHKIVPFGKVNDRFDPSIHEALAQRNKKGFEPGTIIEVYQRGYMINERLLRPAMVIVAGPPEEAQNRDEDPEDTGDFDGSRDGEPGNDNSGGNVNNDAISKKLPADGEKSDK